MFINDLVSPGIYSKSSFDVCLLRDSVQPLWEFKYMFPELAFVPPGFLTLEHWTTDFGNYYPSGLWPSNWYPCEGTEFATDGETRVVVEGDTG